MLVIHSTTFKFFFITLFIIVLTSCAGLISQNTPDHLIKLTEAKVFKVVSVDESGNEINDRLILETLQQNINKLTAYPSFYSAIDDLDENVSGFESVISNKNINVQYLNGHLSKSGNHKLTKVTAIFQIEIKKDSFGLHKTITIHQPKSLHINQAKTKYSEIESLDTPDKLEKDIVNIFNNLNLAMERLMFVSGEIIVRNSEDEVFDNFEHLLGLYSKNSFQETEMIFGIFELKSNLRKDIIPLRVRIYPNSKGSRVKYEFDIKYSIQPDGTTTYNAKEINYLVTTIKNISTTKDLDAPVNHVKVNNKNLVAIIDDPVMISNYDNKSSKSINIHKTTVTFKPRKSTKKKQSAATKKPTAFKPKKITKIPKSENKKVEQVSKSDSKTSNIENIEYIEKMLSSLKKQRPSK